jgi:hypothetical protein
MQQLCLYCCDDDTGVSCHVGPPMYSAKEANRSKGCTEVYLPKHSMTQLSPISEFDVLGYYPKTDSGISHQGSGRADFLMSQPCTQVP